MPTATWIGRAGAEGGSAPGRSGSRRPPRESSVSRPDAEARAATRAGGAGGVREPGGLAGPRSISVPTASISPAKSRSSAREETARVPSAPRGAPTMPAPPKSTAGQRVQPPGPGVDERPDEARRAHDREDMPMARGRRRGPRRRGRARPGSSRRRRGRPARGRWHLRARASQRWSGTRHSSPRVSRVANPHRRLSTETRRPPSPCPGGRRQNAVCRVEPGPKVLGRGRGPAPPPTPPPPPAPPSATPRDRGGRSLRPSPPPPSRRRADAPGHGLLGLRTASGLTSPPRPTTRG